LGVLVQFGDLRYFTAGDLDGEYAVSRFGYSYNDIEKIVAPRVGEVDLYRASHHGSGHSSSAFLLNTLKPTVSLISCGIGNSYGHPAENTFELLKSVSEMVHLTNLCNEERDYENTLIASGDIIVSSLDGTTYTVESGGGSHSHVAKSSGNEGVCP